MAAWPEFESEFESASEYSSPISDSNPASLSTGQSNILVNPVPNCQVTLAILWNHNTQSYQRNCPALYPVKKQPKIVHKGQCQKQPPVADESKPPVGIQNGDKSQPPADQSQPPDIQSQMQPPVASQRRDQSQRLPPKYGIQSQPPAAKKQPPKSQPQSQPPDLPPDPDSSVSKEDWGKGSIDPG